MHIAQWGGGYAGTRTFDISMRGESSQGAFISALKATLGLLKYGARLHYVGKDDYGIHREVMKACLMYGDPLRKLCGDLWQIQ